MAFSELGSTNKDQTILAIKRKYLNATRKQASEDNTKTPLPQKNAANKDKYYESPSRYISSIGQSTIKNSYQETFKENQESSQPFMRDYMTLKAQYTSKNRNKSVTANNKSNIEANFGIQSQSKENGGIRRQLNKTTKQNGRPFVSSNDEENIGKKWSRERELRNKQLQQIRSERANEGRVLKEMNHKVISQIEQMLLRIKNNLKERNS